MYLSNGVSLVVADCYAAVFTAQRQEVLRAPTATCDLLCVLTYTYVHMYDVETIHKEFYKKNSITEFNPEYIEKYIL